MLAAPQLGWQIAHAMMCLLLLDLHACTQQYNAASPAGRRRDIHKGGRQIDEGEQHTRTAAGQVGSRSSSRRTSRRVVGAGHASPSRSSVSYRPSWHDGPWCYNQQGANKRHATVPEHEHTWGHLGLAAHAVCRTHEQGLQTCRSPRRQCTSVERARNLMHGSLRG